MTFDPSEDAAFTTCISLGSQRGLISYHWISLHIYIQVKSLENNIQRVHRRLWARAHPLTLFSRIMAKQRTIRAVFDRGRGLCWWPLWSWMGHRSWHWSAQAVRMTFMVFVLHMLHIVWLTELPKFQFNHYFSRKCCHSRRTKESLNA